MSLDSLTLEHQLNVAELIKAQESQNRSADFRPTNQGWGKVADESWDLYGLGEVVKEVLEKMESFDSLSEWKAWSERATSNAAFESVAHSMDALPGVGDISQYGVKIEDGSEISCEETERIRKKRDVPFPHQRSTPIELSQASP